MSGENQKPRTRTGTRTRAYTNLPLSAQNIKERNTAQKVHKLLGNMAGIAYPPLPLSLYHSLGVASHQNAKVTKMGLFYHKIKEIYEKITTRYNHYKKINVYIKTNGLREIILFFATNRQNAPYIKSKISINLEKNTYTTQYYLGPFNGNTRYYEALTKTIQDFLKYKKFKEIHNGYKHPHYNIANFIASNNNAKGWKLLNNRPNRLV